MSDDYTRAEKVSIVFKGRMTLFSRCVFRIVSPVKVLQVLELFSDSFRSFRNPFRGS